MAATPGLPVSSLDYHRMIINPRDTTQFCFIEHRLHLAYLSPCWTIIDTTQFCFTEWQLPLAYLSLHPTTTEWSSIQQTPHSSASAGSGYTWLTCLLAGPPWAPHSLAPSWPPGRAAARCQRPTPSGSPTSYPAATPAGCLQHTAGQAVKSRRQPMPWFTLYIQQRR